MSFYNHLDKFLKQAHTEDLTTNHFIKDYLDTKVTVSFGKGNIARIPWISFLIKPNITSQGIYPVYLYYKDLGILILAYGISETNIPKYDWDITGKEQIKDFINDKFNVLPFRYGKSYVFRVYDLNNLPSANVIDHDLEQIIQEYHSVMAKYEKESQTVLEQPNSDKDYLNSSSFSVALHEAGLIYSSTLVTRFVASLLTKPFVILTGLSGSGKTKLAQSFVRWICSDKDQYAIVPVGADWTNREPLLGYPNALEQGKYVMPESGVLQLLIRASNYSDKPYFLILDEMNLSHVERYFADFLSVMESGDQISLCSENVDEVPNKISLPSNLFIIGTVNIDETTNMFSPKVLDRANTIEFRVASDEMSGFLNEARELNMKALDGTGAGMAASFLEIAGKKQFVSNNKEVINRALIDFFDELKKVGAEFGYRTAGEILRLIDKLEALDSDLSTDQMIDIAIMQKLLPKLHGSRRKLSPVLAKLAGFCIKKEFPDFKSNVEKELLEKENYPTDVPEARYTISLEKIYRMYRGAIDNGFASFAEA